MLRPSKYGDEFKRDAVTLVCTSPGRSIASIVRELGVNHEMLCTWVQDAQTAEADMGGLSGQEREELKRLHK
ncbi:transposase [Streptosporangium canum]|uniref:transposase n=1 Tax=Streptosporangium canum TaxID=324952 RepID=UPI0036B9B139